MDIRVLAVASLTFFLVIMAAAGAEDVKIMGLMATMRCAPTARGSSPTRQGIVSKSTGA